MSDLNELASKARSTLSQALEALQSGDDVPEKLVEAAAPIAKSMGVLHRIEKTGAATQADVDGALANVRSVLDALQEIGENHPAVDSVMEAVAASLSKMFALSKAVKTAPAKAEPAAKAQPAPAKAEPAAKAQPAPAKAEPAPKSMRKPEPAKAEPAPKSMRKPKPAKAEPAPKSMRKPEPAPAKAESAPKAQPAAVESEPAPESMRKPESARDEEAPRSMRRSERAAAKPTEPAAPPSREKEVVPGNEKAPLPAANARVHDVELGAHSGSNFYKGLSGIDVIEHGGLFVATYKVPKLGQPVAIRVHLPGDLEFEADAIVRWTRDAGGDESDPGFGARFTRISGEGRQLVYRYVRNREPMFYDDL